MQVSETDVEVEEGVEIDADVWVYGEVIHHIALKCRAVGIVLHRRCCSGITHLCKATFAREEYAELLACCGRVESAPIYCQLDQADLVGVLQCQTLNGIVVGKPDVAEEGFGVATLQLIEEEYTHYCAIATVIELVGCQEVDVVEETIRAKPLLRTYTYREVVLLAPYISQGWRERHAKEGFGGAETASRILCVVEVELEVGIEMQPLALR